MSKLLYRSLFSREERLTSLEACVDALEKRVFPPEGTVAWREEEYRAARCAQTGLWYKHTYYGAWMILWARTELGWQVYEVRHLHAPSPAERFLDTQRWICPDCEEFLSVDCVDMSKTALY